MIKVAFHENCLRSGGAKLRQIQAYPRGYGKRVASLHLKMQDCATNIAMLYMLSQCTSYSDLVQEECTRDLLAAVSSARSSVQDENVEALWIH